MGHRAAPHTSPLSSLDWIKAPSWAASAHSLLQPFLLSNGRSCNPPKARLVLQMVPHDATPFLPAHPKGIQNAALRGGSFRGSACCCHRPAGLSRCCARLRARGSTGPQHEVASPPVAPLPPLLLDPRHSPHDSLFHALHRCLASPC